MQRKTLREKKNLAREIRVEDVRVISRGERLHEMMDDAERAIDPGTTLFLFGVPDLWVRGDSRMDGVRPFADHSEWVLGPIFPPTDASQGEMSTIHCLNAQVTKVNNRNGNGTPGWHLHMYYQQRGRFYVKERHRNSALEYMWRASSPKQNFMRFKINLAMRFV